MSVPPFAVGTVFVLASVLVSDRIKDRSILCSVGVLIGMVGLIVMSQATNNHLRYAFTVCCMSGVFMAGPLGLAWIASNTPNPAKRSVIIGINGYSNLASVIAGQLYQAKYKPSYHLPLTVTICLLAIPLLGYPLMRVVYIMINRKRAAKVATWTDEEVERELSDASPRRGDQKLTFQYGL